MPSMLPVAERSAKAECYAWQALRQRSDEILGRRHIQMMGWTPYMSRDDMEFAIRIYDASVGSWDDRSPYVPGPAEASLDKLSKCMVIDASSNASSRHEAVDPNQGHISKGRSGVIHVHCAGSRVGMSRGGVTLQSHGISYAGDECSEQHSPSEACELLDRHFRACSVRLFICARGCVRRLQVAVPSVVWLGTDADHAKPPNNQLPAT